MKLTHDVIPGVTPALTERIDCFVWYLYIARKFKRNLNPFEFQFGCFSLNDSLMIRVNVPLVKHHEVR